MSSNSVDQLKQNWVLLGCVALMLVANYYWWGRLLDQSPAARAKAAQSVLVGAEAPPLLVQTTSGEWKRIEFKDELANAIIYVTSAECIWCTRNIDNIKALAASAGGRPVIAVFSGNGSAGDYKATAGFAFPLYARAAESSREAYRMVGTPQTVAIKDGRVALNFVGAYTGDRESELTSMFNMRFPGLSASTTPSRDDQCMSPDGGIYSVGRVTTIGQRRQRCGPGGNWLSLKDE